MKTLSVVDARFTTPPGKALVAFLCSAALVALSLPVQAKVSISVKDGYRTIESDGMPEHPTGEFPNDHNPNTMAPQTHKYRMPVDPHTADTTTALGMWPFGVAVNGIPFDPFAAEWYRRNPRSGWQYEPMFARLLGIDDNNAHVQPDGSYHYHGVPTWLVQHNGGKTKPALIGYAADGFPMYGPYGYKDANNPHSPVVKLKSSYRLKSGTRPSGPGGSYDGHFVQDFEYVAGLGDLDESNGRTGVTPEYPKGTYYYVVTDAFPFIPRIFKGTPDTSFLRRPPPGGFGQGNRGHRGPPPPDSPDSNGPVADASSSNRMPPPPPMSDGQDNDSAGQPGCDPSSGPPPMRDNQPGRQANGRPGQAGDSQRGQQALRGGSQMFPPAPGMQQRPPRGSHKNQPGAACDPRGTNGQPGQNGPDQDNAQRPFPPPGMPPPMFDGSQDESGMQSDNARPPHPGTQSGQRQRRPGQFTNDAQAFTGPDDNRGADSPDSMPPPPDRTSDPADQMVIDTLFGTPPPPPDKQDN